MLNRLWAWVKSMFDRLFRRKRPITVSDELHDDKLHDQAARQISTRRGGPNMPKHQPCPRCHAGRKRTRKTMGGAHYYCKKCQTGNFVRSK